MILMSALYMAKETLDNDYKDHDPETLEKIQEALYALEDVIKVLSKE